jgi:hypothetical protein
MSLHLTDEQLGATRDGALSGAAAVAADRHLAECAECRERLHELATLDAALSDALDHDPGEEYFASFADRIASRIAAETPLHTPAPAKRRGLAAWWASPQRLAWAGGALALVAVSALVVTLAQQHGPQELASQVAPQHVMAAPPAGAGNDEAAPRTLGVHPLDAGAPPASSAPAPAEARKQLAERAPATLSGAADRRATAPTVAKAREEAAAPQHVLEVRTRPDGEQEVVTPPRAFAPPPPSLQLPNGMRKPGATPLVGETARRSLGDAGATRDQAVDALRKAAGALRAAAPLPVAAPTPVPVADAAPSNMVSVQSEGGMSESVASVAVCGAVRDAGGRPAARALVSIAETGGTATAGADGSFCIDVPEAGATLAVLAVGYHPYRMHVSASSAAAKLAVVLSPVDVLGSGTALSRRDAGARASVARQSAVAASAAALAGSDAGAWITAAHRWETVAAIEPSAPGGDAAFHVAEARVNAWLIGRTEPQKLEARKATKAYLDHAADGAARETALGWQRVLER